LLDTYSDSFERSGVQPELNAHGPSSLGIKRLEAVQKHTAVNPETL
jgi:hypothetical protein